MKRIADFAALDAREAQNYLASHLPKGALFARRFVESSVMYKLILCLSTVGRLVTGQIEVFARNVDLTQAHELLEEWEQSVRIPEKYPRRDTLEGRREAVERKVSKIPVYNIEPTPLDGTSIEEYVRKITGIDITIELDDVGTGFPATFPMVFELTGGTVYFFYVIKVPVEGSALNNAFPIPFPASFFQPQVPQATKELLDIVLDDVIPSVGDWTYEAVVV